MIEEKQKERIKELRDNGLTIKETAKALEISESSVKKYSSSDYEKDNDIDEKSADTITKQLDLEGYDFIDEIKPLVYKLKIQANEIDITLFDYLKDISDTMNKFLRITSKPEWFFYTFMEIANNLSLISDHIEANDLMKAIDNFYNREIEMENAEAFITEIETKAERLVNNAKEECEIWREKTNETKLEYQSITSLKAIMLNKMMSDPNKEKLKLSEESLEKMENQIKELQISNTILIEKGKSLEQINKNNEIAKQDNLMFNMMYEKLYKLFPQEIETILKEIKNE